MRRRPWPRAAPRSRQWRTTPGSKSTRLAEHRAIFSARYAGVGADDRANNSKLVAALAGVPMERRRARYRCALALVFEAKDAPPLIAEGVWEGVILEAPLGSGGFGYDPYFWLPDLGATAAQLDPAQKNRLSHRGRAMRALREQLTARELSMVQA